MAARLLLELYNLSLPTGTGIATYARTLQQTATSLGYEVEGLLHATPPVDPKDGAAAEVAVFDARARAGQFPGASQLRLFNQLVGAPFGIGTARLDPEKRVSDAATWKAAFGELRKAWVASSYDLRARSHFQRYGTAARLRLADPPPIFHATHMTPLRVEGAKNLVTIHDVVPLRLPQATLDDKPYFQALLRYLCRTADRIVTVSEASRRDIIELGGAHPDKVVNTYQSVYFEKELTAASDEDVGAMIESAFDLKPKQYFLFYGALEPKKNVSRLIDAYVASHSARPLVLAGGLGWQYEADLKKIREYRSRGYLFDGQRFRDDKRILRLPYLPRFQLVNLIRGARAVLFPSLYEGFGLPVLEAMLLGTPVVTSNTSSLSEISGAAALLVDPLDAADILRAIRAVDSNEDLRRDLASRGEAQAAKFSREAYSTRLRNLYEGVIAK